MRYERKYRVEELNLAEVRQIVRDHPMSFRTLYPDRQVNNIYFDTPEMHFFHENLYGVPLRHKLRIRWYGPDIRNAEKPILEMKSKDGLLGGKYEAAVNAFSLGQSREIQACLHQGIQALWLDEKVQQDNPSLLHVGLASTLLNTYQRSYLISYDGRFRLTIDWAMHSYGLNARQLPHGRPAVDDAVVIEIKYESEYDDDFQLVGQRIPFRLGKNSKYVMGILLAGNI